MSNKAECNIPVWASIQVCWHVYIYMSIYCISQRHISPEAKEFETCSAFLSVLKRTNTMAVMQSEYDCCYSVLER